MLGQFDQIFLDLFRADDQFRIRGGLVAPERRMAAQYSFAAGSIGARASVTGVANHHQTAAITPKDIGRSAGTKGSVLSSGTLLW